MNKTLLKWVLGLGALLVLCFTLLTGMVIQVARAAGTGQHTNCRETSATVITSQEQTCSSASPYGAAVVGWAMQMADALYVNPACGNHRGGACNDTWYTSAFPQPVLAYGQQWCQTHGGCVDWANGTYQCVSFVRGAYSQVYPMELTNDAFGLWATYQHAPGWQDIPSLATDDPAQRFLPEPGDVMVFRDTGVGHVAIVMQVQAPTEKKNGWIAFANANSSSAYDHMPLRPDFTVDTSEWAASGANYQVWGYLRPKLSVTQSLKRINQLDPHQYASQAEWNTWAYSACSAAAMTEILNAYGFHLRIHDVLVVESARGDIDPTLGLTHDAGVADTFAQFGLQTQWGEHWSVEQVVQTANEGLPVLVGWPPDRYEGGHIVVVVGGDLATNTITLADSSAWNRQAVSVAQFLQWWAGFAAVALPPS
ncbi:MAG TPA: CHAP domain-containing protein [Ktedonobacteraceae bacterium]|nr:CHAP domain-containing protein [Ktedonobacteraceae bacterium]